MRINVLNNRRIFIRQGSLWLKRPLIRRCWFVYFLSTILFILGGCNSSRTETISKSDNQQAKAPTVEPKARVAKSALQNRIEECSRIRAGAQEIRHRKRLLLIIQQAVLDQLAKHQVEGARHKATQSLQIITECEQALESLAKQMEQWKVPDVIAPETRESFEKYCKVQGQFAQTEATRGVALRALAEKGNLDPLLAMLKLDKKIRRLVSVDDERQMEQEFHNECMGSVVR